MSVFSCGLNILHSLVPKSQVTTQVVKLENGDFVEFFGLEIRKQKQSNLNLEKEIPEKQKWGREMGLWNVPKCFTLVSHSFPWTSMHLLTKVVLAPEDIID
jgi:hypothetical protein